jgi:3-carboxy-cis,cis-muconate cycloisomerase
MRQNLDLSRGLINSEAVMMALAPSVGRERAHDLVYAASMRAVDSGRPLRDELLNEPAIAAHLSPEQIDDLLRPESYLGLAPQFVDRALAAVGR